MWLRCAVFTIACTLVAVTQTNPTYDRMGRIEGFIKSVYPDVFPFGVPSMTFVDTPGIDASTGKRAWDGKVEFVLPTVPPSALEERKNASLKSLRADESASKDGCIDSRYSQCGAVGQVGITVQGEIYEFWLRGPIITKDVEAFRDSLPKHSLISSQQTQLDSWTTPPLSSEEISNKMTELGAKYPPNKIADFRKSIPVATIAKFSACYLDSTEAKFESYDEIYYDHVANREKGYNHAQMTWSVRGVVRDPKSPKRNGNCGAEFEPFKGHLVRLTAF